MLVYIFFTCIDLCSFILDIDECSDAHGSCQANADCQNTVGCLSALARLGTVAMGLTALVGCFG